VSELGEFGIKITWDTLPAEGGVMIRETISGLVNTTSQWGPMPGYSAPRFREERERVLNKMLAAQFHPRLDGGDDLFAGLRKFKNK
jgi:hypothetical protein